MTCMKITTIAVGTATYIMVWGGDPPIIPGMTPGTIPGITEVITVAGMTPGFTDTAVGMA